MRPVDGGSGRLTFSGGLPDPPRPRLQPPVASALERRAAAGDGLFSPLDLSGGGPGTAGLDPLLTGGRGGGGGAPASALLGGPGGAAGTSSGPCFSVRGSRERDGTPPRLQPDPAVRSRPRSGG